ncbi:dynein regulatory complex subunit 2 [Colius striatus]|uniref:dynein regulatory complex subunit 2 n=1 Tax=Colius striatus TaxID=57412 RepID=UPI002B1D7593|nr:dynein regulatory complex subunit 2 [Colius striatus]
MAGPRRPPAAAAVSAEDELLLLQSQALAREEAAKAKAEMLTRFLKDKLGKEERNSALNRRKLEAQWRAVLRETKDEELRRDVEILRQTMARVMDGKDSAIESLATDLQEAEEQHARALRSHLQLTDRLLQLQRGRLRGLQDGYDKQLQAMTAEFEAERRAILEQQEREGCYLRDVALATKQSHAESDREATLSFQSAQDDIKNKGLQEQQFSRIQLGGKVQELWEQLQRAMLAYTEATEHHKIAFEALKQKDEKSSREIETQAKKLQKLQDSVAAARGRVSAQLREGEERSRHARREKEKVLRQLQELKEEMKQARAEARDGLARLVMQSCAALKALESVVGKAQRILRLAEMCRKLETEEEKVLPFYPSSLEEKELQDAQNALEQMPIEPLARALWDYTGLERFWQRFNKVKLEEQALERERAALGQRNQQLRELLRQYLAGISIGQEGSVNPLLTIEIKSCVPKGLPHAGGHRAQADHGATRPNSPGPIHGSGSTS